MNGTLFERETPNYSGATFPAPRDFQDRAHQALRDGVRAGHQRQMLMAPTGGGKCLGRDTPVLMADGTVKMVQDVVAGDRLLGPDGGVRNVLSVAAGREQLYRITPKKGMAYVVNASHILSLRTGGGAVVNMNVLEYCAKPSWWKRAVPGWRVPGVLAGDFTPELVDIEAVASLGQGDYFGFELDGDRLFLLGDFTVTHNTYLGLRIAHEALVKGRRALFIADRRTLIDQTSTTADRYGLSAHGVLMSQHWRFDPSMPFQIASAQTLARREWPKADVIIVDEAHTQLAVWVDYITSEACTAKVIGLSATPFSTGLGKLFTNLVNAATMAELTEAGVLVPMRVLSAKRANMEGAATSGGEWTDAAAGERGMEIVGDVVAEWLAHGENRKTIVFGSTIAHCAELCKSFNEAGVMAQLFTSETTEDERKNILNEYRKPDTMLRVLISVEALAKGFDVPDVSCVVDCRPLRKSLSTAIQMWGRGLRSSPETGKKDCLLLDHSGNIIRFADDYAEIFFHGLAALDAGEKLDKTVRKDDEDKEPKACPACGFKPMGKRCIACGHEVQRLSLVEAVPGHMQPVVIGKTHLADNHRHLYEQLVSYTRGNGKPETAKGRAAHLFKHITGQFPDGFSYERTHNVPISKPVMNKVLAYNIARRHALLAERRGQPA